jgi:plastocyanin
MTSYVRNGAACTALVLAWVAAGCGNDGVAPGNGPPDPGDGGPVATTSVSVRDNFFEPRDIVVAPGATVTWTWLGSQVHNVTWVGAALPSSPNQTSGSFGATMPSAPGTRVYYCTLHGTPTSGMRGTVQVE